MPPTEDLPSTPPTFQDEGYGYRVNIDYMIVTPHVLTLGEQSPNVGTNKDVEPQKIPMLQTESNQTSHINDKFTFLKRAVTMMVPAASNVGKDFADLMLEHTSLNNLGDDRLQRIQTLESLLEHEKTINAQL